MALTGHTLTKVYRIPGRLVLTPTDLSAAFPYGGTSLGLTRRASLLYRPSYYEIADPEEGGVTDIIETGLDVRLEVDLREWDDSVLTTLFRHSFTGGSSAAKALKYPQSVRPGLRLSDKAAKFLWAPNNATAHPGILIYAGLPKIVGEVPVSQSTFFEQVFRVQIIGQRDGTDRIYEHALLEDMTL